MNVSAEILIVEDSPTQVERLRLLLESSGYRVRAATSGEEALERLAEHAPELVITDIVMPGIDGYELCSRIKSDPQLRELPVILLTTLSEPGDIIRSLQSGADNYIRKPYDDRYLLTRVGNILTGRELRDGGRMGVEIYLGGERHFIGAERQQILDFLLSTYEETVQLNEALEQRAAEVSAKNAELEARQEQLEQALHELGSEKRRVEDLANVNRAVLDATADGIALVDPQGRKLFWNAALTEICDRMPGVDPGAPVEDNLRAVTALCSRPEEYRQFIESVVADANGESAFDLELPEAKQWLRVFASPVHDAGGEPLGHLFVARDITRDREVDRVKTELVATVSHELRTPLTGILGFAELLAAGDVEPEVRQSYIETVQREGRRLRDLINDFLDLQRIEAGDLGLVVEPMRLDEVIREQAALFATDERHPLELDVEASPVVRGERDRIAQVLANLLSNAAKYSPEGGRVRVGLRTEGMSARVEVADEGIGIPPGQQLRIFEKFFRVDSREARRIGGTGLGLALSREIIEAHGGSIGFTSAEGVGTTFWFEIPLLDAAA